MNIQIDDYNFITLFISFITLLISLISLLVGYYSLIANRPRIFLKTVYVNNNTDKKSIPNFDCNFNLKFINYGEKPAFNIKIFHENENYINSFLDEPLSLNIDKESFKKSLDQSLEKYERDFYQAIYLAKINEKRLYEKNKESIENLIEKEITFIEGKSFELKKLGISNVHSKGGLKKDIHSLRVQYKDLRDLNFLMVLILSFIYIIPYSIFFIYGYISIFPQFLLAISNRTGFIFSICKFKYIRVFEDEIEINIDLENTYFEDDEILKRIDNIIDSMRNTNIFNEQIYSTWEKNLTKSEYKIFKKYRMKYGDNVDSYVELYKKRNIELANQPSLHVKMWSLMEIFHGKNLITEMTYLGLDLSRQLSQK